MSGMEVITVLVAAICYGVASVLRIELSNGCRVTGVAAFGPAVVALGPAAYGVATVWTVLVAALVAQGIAMGLRRSGVRQFLEASSLLFISGLLFTVFLSAFSADGSVSDSASGPLLVATLLATSPYGLVDLVVRRKGPQEKGSIRALLRWEVPLYLVLGSTGGLVVLAFDPLGWVAFPLLLLALLVTWHEFRRFAEARRTYEQTVRAMGQLTERAGYAPVGHHQRVSELAAEVGRELGLGQDQIRALALVGQVQRVGAVSLSGPDEVEGVDPAYVEERGRRILEETSHLAPYAHFLAPDDRGPVLEAEVLRAVDRFVGLNGSPSDRIAFLRREGEVRSEVLGALERSVHVPSA